MMNNSQSEYFYFTPTKGSEDTVTQPHSVNLTDSSISTQPNQRFSHAMKETCDQESQMTQTLFNASTRFAGKYPMGAGQGCSKTLFKTTENNDIDEEGEGSSEQNKIDFESESTQTGVAMASEDVDVDVNRGELGSSAQVQTLKLIKQISKKQSAKSNRKSIGGLQSTQSTALSINQIDSVKSLDFLEQQPPARSASKPPLLSESASKLIAEIQERKQKQLSRTLSPSRSTKVNAILNQVSMKDRYRALLGSKVISVENSINKELLELMQSVETVMLRKGRIFLSELITFVPGLTILKMNVLMNVNPSLYLLSLSLNRFGQQDMVIQLPSSENVVDSRVFREERFADYKQRLFFAEQQQQAQVRENMQEPGKLTNIIKGTLGQTQAEITQAFQQLQEATAGQIVKQELKQVTLKECAEVVHAYFESRNVSNIFKMNLIEQISKLCADGDKVVAEEKFNEILSRYPNWLTEVKSSLLGSIIRINYSFSIQSID